MNKLYQFLILGNVANGGDGIIAKSTMYQFLILGNVEQQIVFFCIITPTSCVVKCEFY